jgi:hypothetical protein
MAESAIMREIMKTLNSFCSAIEVFRNNTGMFKRIRFGLWNDSIKNGTGDLIGWKTIKITPEMVGRNVAVFLSVECKDKGEKITAGSNQDTWRKHVIMAGGIAIETDSVEDCLNKLQHITISQNKIHPLFCFVK